MVLIAKALAELEVDVFLIPKRFTREEGLYLDLDFVLLPFLRKSNEELARCFYESGCLVGVLDQEGGVMPDFDWFQAKLPGPEILDMLCIFFSWGKYVAEQLSGRGLLDQSKVCVTGSPRMDFFVQPMKTMISTPSHQTESLRLPVVLINTRFSLVNPEFNTRRVEKVHFVKYFGHKEAAVEQWQTILSKSLSQTAEMANQLAEAMPDVTFVVRPHPFENQETYRPLLKNLPNLHLIREGPINLWLERACAVIQRCCSTSIEAGLVGVPAFSPKWIEMPHEIEAAESVSVPCETLEELSDAIRLAAEGKFITPPTIRSALSKTIEKWFFKVDGKAHTRVAEAIEAHTALVPRGGDVNSRSKYYRANPNTDGHSRVSRIRRRIVELTGLPVTAFKQTVIQTHDGTAVPWTKSSKGFSRQEVQKLLNQMNPERPLGASRARGHGLAQWLPLHSVRISVRK